LCRRVEQEKNRIDHLFGNPSDGQLSPCFYCAPWDPFTISVYVENALSVSQSFKNRFNLIPFFLTLKKRILILLFLTGTEAIRTLVLLRFLLAMGAEPAEKQYTVAVINPKRVSAGDGYQQSERDSGISAGRHLPRVTNRMPP
jgi:hypothetical protein